MNSLNVYLSSDLRAIDGKWKSSWVVTENGVSTQYHTMAWRSWRGLVNRCKAGGHVQRKRPAYIGCVNHFADFQEFAEWCTHQDGYGHKDEFGRHFHLDKDLISLGNKIYSKDLCCFVPSAINKILAFPSRRSHESLPLGCYFHQRLRKYGACIGENGRSRHLGYFLNPIEAHQAWLIEKAKAADRASAEMSQIVPIAASALDQLAEKLRICAKHGKEFALCQ